MGRLCYNLVDDILEPLEISSFQTLRTMLWEVSFTKERDGSQ